MARYAATSSDSTCTCPPATAPSASFPPPTHLVQAQGDSPARSEAAPHSMSQSRRRLTQCASIINPLMGTSSARLRPSSRYVHDSKLSSDPCGWLVFVCSVQYGVQGIESPYTLFPIICKLIVHCSLHQAPGSCRMLLTCRNVGRKYEEPVRNLWGTCGEAVPGAPLHASPSALCPPAPPGGMRHHQGSQPPQHPYTPAPRQRICGHAVRVP